MADDRHQIAMAPSLDPQDAKAVVGVMEGDALDKTDQDFLERRFRLWAWPGCGGSRRAESRQRIVLQSSPVSVSRGPWRVAWDTVKVSARSGANTHPYHDIRDGNAAVLDHASPNASSSF